MKKTVLIYRFPEEEKTALRKLAGTAVDVIPVPPARYGVSIAELLPPKEEEAAAGGEKDLEGSIRERMMIFAGFEEDAFDAFLASLRENRIGSGALKAVLTPVNARWTSLELYGELFKEREAFFRMRGGQKPWR